MKVFKTTLISCLMLSISMTTFAQFAGKPHSKFLFVTQRYTEKTQRATEVEIQ